MRAQECGRGEGRYRRGSLAAAAKLGGAVRSRASGTSTARALTGRGVGARGGGVHELPDEVHAEPMKLDPALDLQQLCVRLRRNRKIRTLGVKVNR